MADFRYTIVSNSSGVSATVLRGGELLTASDSHPNFPEIMEQLLSGQKSFDEIRTLFDTERVVEERFNAVTERVQVVNGVIYFDGNALNNSLTDNILAAMREGTQDFRPFVNFLVRVEENPVLDSRINLYDWLKAEKFSLREDGFIVGYKGLHPDGEYVKSIHSGRATVNGVEQEGQISQTQGDVVTMPRGNVTLDPASGCSHGLHVGTWGYASGFGAVVHEVFVDPADVVSVPHDCSAQKMRVCRYTLGSRVDHKYGNVVYEYTDDDDDDECCGCDYEDCICS